MGYFTQAQICMNGHTITSDIQGHPEKNKRFCSKCGSAAMDCCENCKSPINGLHINPGYITIRAYKPPSYCPECGEAYPWTSAKIAALIELAKMEEVLSDEEVEVFSSHVKDISSDTPNTVVSANKLIKFGKKFGARAWGEIRMLLVEIASETAKKILLDKG